jgi:hypothetical protein
MGEIQDLGQSERDAAIWAEWVSGVNQTEIGQRRGISQAAVSQAVGRFLATLPYEDRFPFLPVPWSAWSGYTRCSSPWPWPATRVPPGS